MKKILVILVFCLICLSAFEDAQAQNTIAPEKKRLISEIVVVTKADKKIEEIMQAMFRQMNDSYPIMMESVLKDRQNITADQKDFIKNQQQSSAKFQEKMMKAINFQEFVEATIYPLYDKFFSETELKDLLAFYKTPTGQKLNESLPQFTSESFRLSQEYLLPKITSIIEEFITEETNKVTKTPPPKKSNE